ncbi:hypothetical protein Riv7116_6829 [Rivularia sp. PCC 7116]|uniref:hypothetical protein n=1 Tax=Rivularia sp. PCC 7116 TaxID=373994 RepID=UPI00029F020A|nr:hypothetical protein [Rivularia sp. PCC 7116]AFY59145.1 hypothetical protein Riv7116_6829 [Rivularia sp. PCC 7116]
MKLKLLTISLFSLTSVSSFFVPFSSNKALAGCNAIDVNVQVAIDDSPRGRQRNNVSQEFGENCKGTVGTTAVTRSTQVCKSSKCEQKRNNRQRVDGDPNRRTGVNTNNIGIKVDVPVHVKKPNTPKPPSFRR